MKYTDVNAEQKLIGNLICDPKCIVELLGLVTTEDFSCPQLGAAFGVVMEAFTANRPIDATTMAEKANLTPDILASCVEHEEGWFSSNVKFTAARVAELAHKRRTLAECRKLAADLQDLDSNTISCRLSEISASILAKSPNKKVYDSSDLYHLVSKIQDERREMKGAIAGAPTGFPTLDKNTGGLQPKRATVLAAGTGFGKTSLGVNIWVNVAIAGHPVLLISTENDVRDNVDRICGIITGKALREIEDGYSGDEISEAFKLKLLEKSAFISDNSPRTIDEICGTISRYALQNGIKVAIVDYVGEISGEGLGKETEEARLARYGQRLVDCARSMGIHIMILAQLNREGNVKGRPTKADIAGCFKLAQKAHTMLLFWQDDKQDVLTIEKNRQGPAKVDIAVSFDRSTQVIREEGVYLASKKAIYSK